MERVPYDEFSMFHENAEEFGLPYDGPPTVRRESVEVEPGRRLSALVWGDADPELVFLHGGAQNAHTWDTVAMALGRPLVALDLPGHGHSDGGREGIIGLRGQRRGRRRRRSVRWPPTRRPSIGMSLGGMTTIALADHAPELVRKVVLVDVTPGVNEREVVDHRRVHQRPRELRQLRRPAGAHDRVQPDPHRVVAAARHPAQRRAARGRQLGVALPALPRVRAEPGRGRGRPPELPVPLGRGVTHPGAAAARARHARAVGGRRRRRGRAPPPSARTRRSSTSRRPATASRATPPSSSPRASSGSSSI